MKRGENEWLKNELEAKRRRLDAMRKNSVVNSRKLEGEFAQLGSMEQKVPPPLMPLTPLGSSAPCPAAVPFSLILSDPLRSFSLHLSPWPRPSCCPLGSPLIVSLVACAIPTIFCLPLLTSSDDVAR